MPWNVAIHRPGATQMQHLRKLIAARPFASLVPAADLVDDELEGEDHVVAARGDGYTFVYSPNGRSFALRLTTLKTARLRMTWWNPRSGHAEEHALITVDPSALPSWFTCPAEGFGADWVLVLDDESRGFALP